MPRLHGYRQLKVIGRTFHPDGTRTLIAVGVAVPDHVTSAMRAAISKVMEDEPPQPLPAARVVRRRRWRGRR